MSNKYTDITEAGELDYRELLDENNKSLNLDKYIDTDGYTNPILVSKQKKSTSKKDEKQPLTNPIQWDYQGMSQRGKGAVEEYYKQNPWRYDLNNPVNRLVEEEYTTGDRSYRTLGKSSSRYDKYANDISDWENIDDFRGRQQSGFNQIMSGLGKMAVVAGTTVADNFIGTVAGIGNVVVLASKGNINSGRDAMDAFVSNPVSRWLININDESDEWMPIYETDQERNAPWYQKFWHASFIGDHLMKNTGFFVGSILSGKASAGVLSNAKKFQEARNIFKNTAMAVGLDDQSAKAVFNAYKRGEAIGSVEKVTDALGQAAKNARNAEHELKLISSALGSFGESRMEAISGSNEWFDKELRNIEQRKALDLQNLEIDIVNERPDLFALQPVLNQEGQIVGYQRVIADQEGFNAEYNSRRQNIEDRYNKVIAEASKYRADYANSSFIQNMVWTFGENFFVAGDAITGSYSKKSLFNNRLKQSAKKTVGEAGAEIVEDASKKGAKWIANKSIPAREIATGFLGGPAFELNQEMVQATTLVTLDRWNGAKLNSYYGDILDPEGIKSAGNYAKTFADALGFVYTDADQWENGALGFVTALLPLIRTERTSSTQHDDKSVGDGKNKPKRKIVVGGEFWESINQARENYKESKALADALNAMENDDVKMQRFYNILKLNKSQLKKQAALDKNSQKDYKNEELDDLASLVMTYSDAGQIDYLKLMVDEFYTVENKALVDAVRRNTIYEEGEGDQKVQKSLYDDMSDQEIIDYFKELRQKKLDLIDKLNDIYKNTNTLYGDFGGGKDADAYRKTLASKIMQIDDHEERIKLISSEFLDQVKGYADKLRRTVSYKDFPEFEEAINQLTNLANIDVVLSEDGVIQKLEREQQRFVDKQSKKLKQLLQDKEMLEFDLNNAKKEVDQISKLSNRTADEIYRRIKEIQKPINYALGRIKMIDASRTQFDFHSKLKDLQDLLTNREMLYTSMASLGGQNGFDLFKNVLSLDLLKVVKSYDDKALDRIYQDYKNLGRMNFYGYGINNVIKAARRNDDEEIATELENIQGAMELFNVGELNPNDPNVIMVQNDVVELVLKNRGKSTEEIDKEIDNYLSNKTGIKEIDGIKDFIADNRKKQKQRKEDQNKAQESVLKDSPKQTKNSNAVKDFFKKTPEGFSKFLDDFKDSKEFADYLKKNNLENVLSAMLLEDWGQEDISGSISFEDEDYDRMKDDLKILRENSKSLWQESEPEQNTTTEETEKEPKKSSPEPTPRPLNVGVVTTEDGLITTSGVNKTELTTYDDDAEEDNIVIGEAVGGSEIENKDIQDGNSLSMPESESKKYGTHTDAWDVLRWGLDINLTEIKKNVLEPYKFSENDLENMDYNIHGVYMNALKNFKSPEFIQSGLLAKVTEYYYKHKPEKANVRFVMISDYNVLGKGNRVRNFVTARIPLAAIELSQQDIDAIVKEEKNDRLREILKKQFQDYTKIVTLYGKEGKKTFQILGDVTPEYFGFENATYKGKVGKKLLYRDTMFQKFIDSFKDDIEHTGVGKEEVFDEDGNKINPNYYKYSSFSSPIEYFYTGRLIKQDSTHSQGQRYLREILSEDQLANPEGHLQIRVLYDEDRDKFLDYGMPLGGRVVRLNRNFGTSFASLQGQTRNGTVWILTKEANGNVYYKGARVNLFDRAWYDLHKNDTNNAYLNGIRKAIKGIVLAKDTKDAMINYSRLDKYIYQGKKENKDVAYKLYVDNNGKRIRINDEWISYDGADNSNADQFVDEIIDTMLRKNSAGYRFSFINNDVTSKLTLKDIVDSDVISTDLATLHNVGASIAISKIALDKNTGEFVERPSKDFEIIRMTREHTGMIGVNPSKQEYTISIDGKDLTVKSQNGQIKYYVDGKEVDKKDVSKYEKIVNTYNDAYFGNIKSVFEFRGSNMYLYTYQNGTIDRRPQGVVFSTNRDHKHHTLNQKEVALLMKITKHEKLTDQEVKDIIKIFNKINAHVYSQFKADAEVTSTKGNPSTDTSKQTTSDESAKNISKMNDVLKARYGDTAVLIGDTIQYAIVSLDDNLNKVTDGVEYMEALIIGSNKDNTSVKLSTGKFITLEELDLFYGKTKKIPSKSQLLKQYRHIDSISKDGGDTFVSQFNIEDSFENTTVSSQPQSQPKNEATPKPKKGQVFAQPQQQQRGGGSLFDQTGGRKDVSNIMQAGDISTLSTLVNTLTNKYYQRVVLIYKSGKDKGVPGVNLFEIILNSSDNKGDINKEALTKLIRNNGSDEEILNTIELIIQCHSI